MKLFSAAELAAVPPRNFVEAMRAGFKGDVTAPPRFVSTTIPSTTFFAMPAWNADFTGIKTITLKGDNPSQGLPTIQGTYQLFDNATGTPVALLDGAELTRQRTAAASALAADFLARKDSSTLLLIGAGALAPCFARAIMAVRPIKRVLIFNRTRTKAEALATEIGAEVVDDLAAACGEADIISCVTSGLEVVLKGEWVKPGTHLDLVGAYKPNMREADATAVGKARVYVDTHEGALHEGGDLLQAQSEGMFKWADIQADLHDLCRGTRLGRKTDAEVTLFKSVGTALEDLAAAAMVYLRAK